MLPEDADRATLLARVFDPEAGGPCVAAVRGDRLVDLTRVAPTTADLLERADAAEVARSAPAGRAWPLAEVVGNALARRFDRPHLLAPCDIQVIKACGVTYARSLLERVIEERAKGDPSRAAEVRLQVQQAIGGAIADLVPGSADAARVKRILQAEGLWSQYLEVGIGPDAEVFTKAPVLSAVGLGAEIGVPRDSTWNNPEPELVLAVTSRGEAVAATLGNDVNLRDVEGRSALLLPKAKDNNASCAVGPFLRLFDAEFGIADVRAATIALHITGTDGFVLDGHSSVERISRDPLELVGHAMGDHHQYPDGIMLFTGTEFAPTEDRDEPGMGFTHRLGDVVRISSPRLGTLVNRVAHSESAPPWTFGVRALMTNLAARGLLDDTR
ncbi:fumarylacetoacetate hydrolase [Gandjariella thermophila]|uniref:Fumarylacetoacetate hydrolase n=1 Tax=Gandjariella thermophila TaxID=1931992 RepID=A0A4D4JIP2_9PSEU|nr:fumarylacetoacetate hydrolase [Gandjariella thermophila]